MSNAYGRPVEPGSCGDVEEPVAGLPQVVHHRLDVGVVDRKGDVDEVGVGGGVHAARVAIEGSAEVHTRRLRGRSALPADPTTAAARNAATLNERVIDRPWNELSARLPRAFSETDDK